MARSQIAAAFFSPPTLPEAPPRPSDWVLMNKLGYIAKRENATTARCLSSRGDLVEVSFCLADPPAISYMCVHLRGLVGRVDSGFNSVPAVVVAVGGAFVLLDLSFCNDGWRRHYFVYKAGPGKPWIRSLPKDPTRRRRDFFHCEIGILPIGVGDGEDGFVVAALVPYLGSQDRPPFDLCIFSSSDGAWRTEVPRLDPSAEEKVYSHHSSKVIAVGEGLLGWVDMWQGILLCNVLAEVDPVLHLVRLPKPAKAARPWKSDPEIIRGLASDGNNHLRFVELTYPKDPCPPPVPDSDSDSDAEDDPGYVRDGWRAITWKRTLFSPDDDQWSKDCTADSDEILEGEPSGLLPELWDVEAGRISLNNMYSKAPVLGMHDDGVVYMILELDDPDDEQAWMVAFDVRNKSLKALVPFTCKTTPNYENYCIPCSFSKYLCAAPAGQLYETS